MKFTHLFLTALLGLVLAHPSAQAQSPGELDATFESGSLVNNTVRAVASAGDGKVYVGGDFTTVRGAERNRIARLNADGTVDASFNPGMGASNAVNAVAVQADGKVLIGGNFTTYNGTARSRIARLNADGSLDTSFAPGAGANNTVNAVAVQANGKVLIGGSFFIYNGTARNYIARLNSDGSLDTSFNPGTGTNTTVNAVAVQVDGKVLIGGFFASYNGTGRSRIARLNADGSLDTSFNPGTGASNAVNAVAVHADGKVLIGGGFTSYNGTARSRIARLNADGSLDTSFNPGSGANSDVYAVVVQADGKVLIGGGFNSYNGTLRSRIARLNADGSLDTNFVPDTGANNTVNAVAVQANGKVLIGGVFTTYNGTGRSRIARLNADGSLDTSFDSGTGASSDVSAVAVQADGKVLIGGLFTSYNGTLRSRIARLNADGSLDTSFNQGSGASSTIRAMAVQTDGKVLIGGNFTSYNGTARSRIARLNADGSLDTSFNPGTGANSTVNAVVVQADGKVLIGGGFNSYNGTGRNRIARLNADGSLDTSFNPGTGADSTVYAVAVQADGKVLIGGLFASYNGTVRSRIARLNVDGSLDTSLNPGSGANSDVYAVAVQADGKALIGGVFTSYNGMVRNRIARLNADGSLDTSFNPGTGANNDVNAVAVQADGKVLIGGNVDGYNGTGRAYLARVANDAATSSLTAVSAATVRWLRGGSAPEIEQVAFESSTDGGTNWTPLGSATRISGGWESSGLSLPGSGQLRARGRATGGYFNGSSSVIEQVAAFSFASPPTVTSLNIPSGSTAGGTSVTITGTGFTGATSVTFGGVDAVSFVVVNDTTITAVTPAGSTGSKSVEVITPGGTSAENALYSYNTPLFTDHFTGNSGSVPAGWTGLAFDTSPASTVAESGTLVTIADARGFNGPKLIQSPAFGGISEFDLTVDIASMIGASDGMTTSEPQALIALGTPGSAYLLVVKFLAATQSFEVLAVGATQNTLVVPGGPHLPAYAGGTVKLRLRGDADSFRISSPTNSYDSGDILYSAIGVAGFDSLDDLGSTPRLIIGTESAGSVTNGTLATVAFDRVVLDGTAVVLTAPTVTSLDITSGSTAGGTSVTITGTGFTDATSVTFGGVDAVSFTVVNDTTITAVTPAGSSGSSSVVVTTAGGSNAANTLYTYTVPPDYLVTTTGNAIVVTDSTGNGDTLAISDPSAGNIQFAAAGRNFSVNGGANISGNSGSLSRTGVTSITVNAAAGADTINVGAFSGSLPSLTLNGGTGDDTVNFNGDLTFASNANLDVDLQNDDVTPGTDAVTVATNANILTSGTGTLVVKASRSLLVNAGGSLETVNGGITIEANLQVATTNATFDAVDVNGGTIRSTGSGNVTIAGKGGVGGGANPSGVVVRNAGVISGGTSGTVSVTGTGGTGSSDNSGSNNLVGVSIEGTSSRVISAGANIHVTGIGGTSSGPTAGGVLVIFGGSIAAGGDGSVNVTGTGGIGTNFNYGVDVVGTNSMITSSNGPVTVIGTGGSGSGSSTNFGVLAQLAGIITGGGTNIVTVAGTGGSGTGGLNHGVIVQNASGVAKITSGGGNVVINGTAGTGGAGSLGVAITDGSVSTATNGGNITLAADSIGLVGTVITNSSSTVTLRQKSNAVAINLGSAVDTTAGTLELSTTELNNVTAGTLIIGDANSGTTTISAVISPANYKTLDVQKGVTFSATGGFASDVTSMTVFEKIKANGAVVINTSATLTATVIGGFVPAAGDSFTILDNTSASTTTGNFSGKTAGTAVALGGVDKYIRYVGGTGNDVTLDPPPPTLASISPSSGIIAGGTSVTLSGTNFTGATGVTFGGVDAASFTVNSGTQITATTPAHTAGAVSVVVTTAGGSNAANTLFTYLHPAEIEVFTGGVVAAENERADYVGIYGFPRTILPHPSAVQAFTIRNSGEMALTGIAVTSTNAAEFVVTGPGVTTLAPGATATFGVVFAPGATGDRSGVIEIASNDADEGIFEISVAGVGSDGLPINTVSTLAKPDGSGAQVVGEPAGTTYHTFNGAQAVNESGADASTAIIRDSGGALRHALVAGSPPQVIVSSTTDLSGTGLPVGTTPLNFRDPLINDEGHVAYIGDIQGPGFGSANRRCLFTNVPDGVLKLVMRQTAADGTTGANFKAPAAYSLAGRSLLFLAQTDDNRTGLYAWDNVNGTTLLMRTGTSVLAGGGPKTIQEIVGLQSNSASSGQSEEHLKTAGNEVRICVMLKFTDNTRGIFKGGFNQATSVFSGFAATYVESGRLVDAHAGASAVLPNARMNVFGSPGWDQTGEFFGFTTYMLSNLGGVTSFNDSAVLVDLEPGELVLQVRENEVPPGITGGAVFKDFYDVVVGAGEWEFLLRADIRGGGSTASNNDGLWAKHGTNGLQLVAREGGAVPGVPGGTFKQFVTYALPGTGQPFFGALLTTGVGGITTANDAGLWAMNSIGEVNKVIREGDVINVGGTDRTVQTITSLESTSSGAIGSRIYTTRGSMRLLVKFTDGLQAMIDVDVP